MNEGVNEQSPTAAGSNQRDSRTLVYGKIQRLRKLRGDAQPGATLLGDSVHVCAYVLFLVKLCQNFVL